VGLKAGDWVDLGDGRVALIAQWDEANGVATAETPTGSPVERPVSFAKDRWRPLPESGLRVAAALDLKAVKARAEDSPVEVLILALTDLGGRADTSSIRDLISPLVIAPDEWERWWRRTQTRLENDDRIDASRARDKVYAVQARAGAALGRSLVPALREETRRDRRIADGPQLKRARERAMRKGPADPDDDALFRLETALAGDAAVDPTDRFMAAELGMWLARWTDKEARAMLGDDALALDILRIPQHPSKSLALDWGLEHAGSGSSITFRSAVAAGSPWSERVLTALEGSTGAVREAAWGLLGWSIPGDDDAGPAKLKDDIPTYERRIERAEELLETLPEQARLGLWDGALHALRALPGSSAYAKAVIRLRERIARLAWLAYQSLDSAARPPLRSIDPMNRDALAPLLRSASTGPLTQVRSSVIRWYANDPVAQLPNLMLLAELLDEDVLALGQDAARQIIRKTNLPRIASQLFHLASEDTRIDPSAMSIVNLAVTTAADDSGVAAALDRLAESIAGRYLLGAAIPAGPMTFSASGWDRFSKLVALRLEEATANESTAEAKAAAALQEAAQLRELADVRAQSLTEARTSAGAEARQDVGRLASNLLKPVALALGDSFEAKSLESLQDRLLAVLQRARIVPIHEVGDISMFDPARHQWVGNGAPPSQVQARSPGFIIEGEGLDGIVLVPARVIATGAP
jgi:hypothetical protein